MRSLPSVLWAGAVLFAVLLLSPFTASSHAQTIVYAEYFFDTDPGPGLATSALPCDGAFDEADEEFCFDVPPTEPLCTGKHTLFLRVLDSDSIWATRKLDFFVVSSLQYAEVFWGADPGNGNGLPVYPTDGTFNGTEESFEFPMTAPMLPDGQHEFTLRVRDQCGVWSQRKLAAQIASSSRVDPNWLTAAQFRIDNNLWHDIASTDGTVNEPTERLWKLVSADTTLAIGAHTAEVRVQDRFGVWSTSRLLEFNVQEYNPYKKIKAGEVFIDTDPGKGNAYALHPTDSAFSDPIEMAWLSGIPTSDLTFGQHSVYVRFKDNFDDSLFDGWGETAMAALSVSDGIVIPSPNLMVRSVAASPDIPFAGQDVVVTAVIANVGEIASGEFATIIREQPGGSVIGEIIVPDLAPGAEAAIEVVWSAGCGQFDLEAVADANATIDEPNELDNAKSRSLTTICADDFQVVIQPPLQLAGLNDTVNYEITVFNFTDVPATVTLNVSGLGTLWSKLTRDSLWLPAHGYRSAEMNIATPTTCIGVIPELDFTVSAHSADPPLLVSGSAGLSVDVSPAISDLYPENGQLLASNDVSIVWRSLNDCFARVMYRAEGQSAFAAADGSFGRIHEIILDGLVRNTRYFWFAVDSTECGTVTSELRSFFVSNGAIFTGRPYSFAIQRDYNQERSVFILNEDSQAHEINIEAITDGEDLTFGFVGSGGTNQSILLGPGMTAEVPFVLHAQDARDSLYNLQFRLTANRQSAQPIVDYAWAEVRINVPYIIFHFEELSFDSTSLIRTMRIVNDGDIVTDLSVQVKQSNGIGMHLYPQIQHDYLASGAAREFQVIPIFANDGSRADNETVLEATAAGHSVEEVLVSICDKQLIPGHVQNALVTSGLVRAWYCTNHPFIRLTIEVRFPCGTTPPEFAYLKDEFMPLSQYAIENHTVDHHFDGEDLVPILENTVPNGEYLFKLPGHEISCSMTGVSSHTVDITTQHLNGGHYVVNTGVQLQFCFEDYSETVCANSQAEADSIVANRPYVQILDEDLQLEFLEPLAGDWIEPGSQKTLRLQLNSSGSEAVAVAAVRVFPDALSEIALGHRGAGVYEGTWNVPEEPRLYQLRATAEICGVETADTIDVVAGLIRLIAPNSNDSIGTNPLFVWNDLNCDHFLIEFGIDSTVTADAVGHRPAGSFDSLFESYTFNLTDSCWSPQVGMFARPGDYFWHVTAFVNGRYIPYSEIRRFTIVSTEAVSVDVTTSFDCVTMSVSDASGTPVHGAKVRILREGTSVRGFPTDIEGSGTECKLTSGEYSFEVTQLSSIVARGEFTIDTTNIPPRISSVLISPLIVGNQGADTIDIVVYAVDPEQQLQEVYLDLSAVLGSSHQVLENVSDSTFAFRHPVSDSVVSGSALIKAYAVDELLARSERSAALTVGSGSSETRTIGMFRITAAQFQQLDQNLISAAGDVHISDTVFNALDINPQGVLILDMQSLSITANGDVEVSVNLGSFGRHRLFKGQFNLDAATGLMTPEQEANYLLDEIAGFVVDPSQLELDITFGPGGGIEGAGVLDLDGIDGIPGNGRPFADFQFHLGFDGKVSGSLQSDSIWFDIHGTTVLVKNVDWIDTLMVAREVSVLPPNFIESLNAGTIEIDSLILWPSGIDLRNIRFEDWRFDAGGFVVEVDSGRILANGLQVTGRVELTQQFGYVEVERMTITDQGISIEGGGFELPDLQVDRYKLGGVRGKFVTANGALYIEGQGSLGIPSLANVQIKFALDSSCRYLLKEFCMAATDLGPGIPIGSTGFFLTAIGGCIVEESPAGYCGDTWVIVIDVSVASNALHIPIINKKAVQGDVQLRIAWGSVHGEGRLYLAGLELGNGYFDLDATAFHGHGGIAIPPEPGDWLSATADIWVRSQPQLALSGNTMGDLTVPGAEINRYLWFWHDDIQVSNFNGGFDNRGIYGSFNVANMINLAIELFWNGQVALGGNLDDRGEKSSGSSRRIPRFTRSEKADSIEVTVLEKDATMVFGLKRTLSEVSMMLIAPNGMPVDSTTTDPNVGYSSSPTGMFFVVEDPLPGRWVVAIDNAAIDTGYAFQALAINHSPTLSSLSLSDLSANSNDSIMIQWQADDLEGDPLMASISYVLDSPNASPVVIADSIQGSSTFWWQPRNVPSGAYRILVRVFDCCSQPTSVISSEVVAIANTAPPLRPVLSLPINGNREVRLEWSPPGADDVRGYVVYWANKDSLIWNKLDAGLAFDYTIKNLNNDEFYKFALQAYDSDSNFSEISVPMYATPRDYADATSPAPPVLSISTDRLPDEITLIWPKVSEAAGYEVYYDTEPHLPLEGFGLVQGSSPIDVYLDTVLTLSGLTQGASYFFMIRAYDILGNLSALTPPSHVLICCTVDDDADGMDDHWEMHYFGSTATTNEMFGDIDNDGLSNIDEQLEGTNPLDPDSDDDTILDGDDANPMSAADRNNNLIPDDWETYWSKHDPTCAIDSLDTDSDRLDNRGEYQNGTSPTDEDSDDDGFWDALEVNRGSDPLDSTSLPTYLAGDSDGDGLVMVSDAVFIINYLFANGPSPEFWQLADCDCSGRLDITDVVYLINYIFGGGYSPGDPDGDGQSDCGSRNTNLKENSGGVLQPRER